MLSASIAYTPQQQRPWISISGACKRHISRIKVSISSNTDVYVRAGSANAIAWHAELL
jgi:hypothetical protein